VNTKAPWRKVVLANEREMFDFLDGLKAAGTCDMLASRPYLIKCFSVSPSLATEVLGRWIKSSAHRQAEAA